MNASRVLIRRAALQWRSAGRAARRGAARSRAHAALARRGRQRSPSAPRRRPRRCRAPPRARGSPARAGESPGAAARPGGRGGRADRRLERRRRRVEVRGDHDDVVDLERRVGVRRRASRGGSGSTAGTNPSCGASSSAQPVMPAPDPPKRRVRPRSATQPSSNREPERLPALGRIGDRDRGECGARSARFGHMQIVPNHAWEPRIVMKRTPGERFLTIHAGHRPDWHVLHAGGASLGAPPGARANRSRSDSTTIRPRTWPVS